MGDLPDTSRPLPVPRTGTPITSRLFETYLACPTKCFLRSIGEAEKGNAFTSWAEMRTEAYRLEGAKRLTAGHSLEFDTSHPEPSHWRNAQWDFALNRVVRAQSLEASIHVVQRIPAHGKDNSLQFVPIRLVPTNKLSRADKLMAGFDALVLSKALALPVGMARIIHGDKWSTFRLKPDTLSREVKRAVGKIAALLSVPSPPDLILNRHCPECEFHDRCRKKAIEKDDLSLLTNLTAKERARLNGKGIFTVSQLSYTFRPRRRAKRLSPLAEGSRDP
jgi:predicted RecB family nuclease